MITFYKYHPYRVKNKNKNKVSKKIYNRIKKKNQLMKRLMILPLRLLMICSHFHKLLQVEEMLQKLPLILKLLKNRFKQIHKMMKIKLFQHFQIVFREMMEHLLLLNKIMLKQKMKKLPNKNQKVFRIMMLHKLLQVWLLLKIFNKKLNKWVVVLILMQNNSKYYQLKQIQNKASNHLDNLHKQIYKVFNFCSCYKKICKELYNLNLKYKGNNKISYRKVK